MGELISALRHVPVAWLERAVLLVALGAAAWVDGRTRRIPNGLIVATLVAWVGLIGVRVVRYGLGSGFALGRVGAALALAGASLALAFAVKRRTGEVPLGGGDVKLLLVMGLYLGFLEAVAAVGAGCVLAVLCSGVRCVVCRGDLRSLRGATFALAPWLFAGTALVELLW